MKKPTRVLHRTRPARRGIVRLGAVCLLAVTTGIVPVFTCTTAEAVDFEPAPRECFFELACDYLCDLYCELSDTVCDGEALEQLVTGFSAPVSRRLR
jgi:hypothetical protein